MKFNNSAIIEIAIVVFCALFYTQNVTFIVLRCKRWRHLIVLRIVFTDMQTSHLAHQSVNETTQSSRFVTQIWCAFACRQKSTHLAPHDVSSNGDDDVIPDDVKLLLVAHLPVTLILADRTPSLFDRSKSTRTSSRPARRPRWRDRWKRLRSWRTAELRILRTMKSPWSLQPDLRGRTGTVVVAPLRKQNRGGRHGAVGGRSPWCCHRLREHWLVSAYALG